MPIQKDRSKDLPGKDGYSWRDREKLIDVVKNPHKYDVDPNSGGNGNDEDNCLDKLFQFLFLAIAFGSLFLKG